MSIVYKEHGFLSPRRQVTKEDKKIITSVFHDCSSGDGVLSREDIKVAVVSLFGYKPSKYEVQQLMGQDELHRPCQTMSEDRFVEVMSSKMAVKDKDELIRETFLSFDTHCRGFLTLEDLKSVFSQVAPHLSKHTVESTFREIDRNGDGRVSYKDFEFMMKYCVDDV